MRARCSSWCPLCFEYAVIGVLLISGLLDVTQCEEDPFADLAQILLSDSTRLRTERDAKRQAYKEADAALKDAKREVEDLERRLQDAREALRRNETVREEAKQAKEAAEKAVLSGLTNIVSSITERAEGKLGELKGGLDNEEKRKPALGRDEPPSGAEVILWEKGISKVPK